MRVATAWLGRAVALFEAAGSVRELAELRVQISSLTNPGPFAMPFQEARIGHAIALAIDTVVAKVELKLPAQAQGAFIPAGGLFDAFQAVAKPVGVAQSDVLMVDPYTLTKSLLQTLAPWCRRMCKFAY